MPNGRGWCSTSVLRRRAAGRGIGTGAVLRAVTTERVLHLLAGRLEPLADGHAELLDGVLRGLARGTEASCVEPLAQLAAARGERVRLAQHLVARGTGRG